MLRGCGGAGMPGAGATELSPSLQDNSIKYTNRATILPRYQHQSVVEYFRYDISAKTSDGATNCTFNQEKERFKRVLGVHEQSSNHSLTSLDN